MKTLKNIICSLILLVSISGISFASKKKPLSDTEAAACVFDFMQENSFDHEPGVATVFTNFIVKERGENFAIDFLVTEESEILILSVKSEDEFYRIDESYNARYVQSYSVPVSTVI